MAYTDHWLHGLASPALRRTIEYEMCDGNARRCGDQRGTSPKSAIKRAERSWEEHKDRRAKRNA